MNRNIYVAYGSDALSMTQMLLETANIHSRIPQGASIALKPNLVVGKHPDEGATTHTGILEGIIQYLQDHGHRNIAVMEGAWVGDSTQRGVRACGYDTLCKRYNVPFYDLKQDKTRKVDTAIGPMSICVKALDTDYLINLPVLKGHCQVPMTCALKICKGCLPDSEKRRFHSMGLYKPIAALAAKLKPALTIVDSICGDLNFEEGGTPIQTNRMLLGEDMVQLDAYGCQLMGIDPYEVAYIPLAQQYGAGSMELSPKDFINVNTPQDAPAFPPRTGLVARLTRNVEQRSACSACYGNLVHALYRLEREHRCTYQSPIAIGQEFAGQPFDGVGIGRCCDCAAKQVKGCPPSAEAIMKVLLEEYSSR